MEIILYWYSTPAMEQTDFLLDECLKLENNNIVHYAKFANLKKFQVNVRYV